MQVEQKESAFDTIYHELVQRGSTTPTQLAHALQFDLSTVSRSLNALVSAGLADRVRSGREVRFSARRNLYTSFTGPLGKDRDPDKAPWGLISWRTDHPVDWRFPLVARVPDEDAQKTLLRFMNRCQEQGLFHPWLTLGEKTRNEWLDDHTPEDRPRLAKLLDDPRTWGGHQIVVYGSCARGDARQDSDLDLLIIGPSKDDWDARFKTHNLPAPPQPPWKEPFRACIDDMNLRAPRHIDPVFGKESQLSDLPRVLREAIKDQGITVYTHNGTDLDIEAWRATHGK